MSNMFCLPCQIGSTIKKGEFAPACFITSFLLVQVLSFKRNTQFARRFDEQGATKDGSPVKRDRLKQLYLLSLTT